MVTSTGGRPPQQSWCERLHPRYDDLSFISGGEWHISTVEATNKGGPIFLTYPHNEKVLQPVRGVIAPQTGLRCHYLYVVGNRTSPSLLRPPPRQPPVLYSSLSMMTKVSRCWTTPLTSPRSRRSSMAAAKARVSTAVPTGPTARNGDAREGAQGAKGA